MAGPALLKQSCLVEKWVIVVDATAPQEHHRVREPMPGRPGTCSGTGTGYHPTALPTVASYGPTLPEQVPGLVLDTRLLQARSVEKPRSFQVTSASDLLSQRASDLAGVPGSHECNPLQVEQRQ